MNKIIIENNHIEEKILDTSIVVKHNENNAFLNVINIEIEILSNTNLEIIYDTSIEKKFSVKYNINNNANVFIFEKYINGKIKISNTYNLNHNTKLNVQKLYDVNSIKQFDIVNLNSENANVDYVLKTICKEEEKYNLTINHNAKNTISNVINNAVNIKDGSVFFEVTGSVTKGKIGCCLNQVNRIVTFNKNKCQINPILLIDEYDVSANHSAFVGKFNDNEIFYLQSRGISYNEATKLLTKGFITNKLILDSENTNFLDDILKKYWG